MRPATLAPVHLEPSAQPERERWSPRRDALAIFALALSLRLIFAALMADTYDPDEFVLLALSRNFAHGAVPYRDFAFFHPPGVLVILRLLDPLVARWWPLARLVWVVFDCITALLIWRIGLQLYGRREAIAAGVLYSLSPIALLSGVRIDQDTIMTTCGMAGLALLLVKRSGRAAALAGACLAAALWMKYSALLFVPIYILAAWSLIVPLLFGFVAGAAILFSPFLPQAHLLYQQSVEWQLFHRIPNPWSVRLEKVGVFWLLANPLAVIALGRIRSLRPGWLVAGYGMGGLFLFAAQVHYHYYVPIAAFAALLAAPVAARLRLKPATLLIAALLLTVAWAIDITSNGPGRRLVSATRLSGDRPTVQFIERHTHRTDRILADRYEYAYLSGRRWVPYFWNMTGALDARNLTRLLVGQRTPYGSGVQLVVRSRYAGGLTYPPAFMDYLDTHFTRYETPAATIWVARS